MIQSLPFWLLLAVTVPVFWALPLARRLPFLATASIGYLLYLEPLTGISMLGWALLFYFLPGSELGGRLLRGKVTLAMVLAILVYLAYFKYLPRLVNVFGSAGAVKVLVPLGLSYFTFKLIHYVIERRRARFAQHSLDEYLCYVFLFPIFTAGPIERFDHFQANRETRWQADDAAEGLTRIAHGLIKKLVLCNAIILPELNKWNGVNGLLDVLDVLSTPYVWFYFALSFLYFYLDFSSYSDIAIGCSRLFGLRIAENFNWPILARNMVDFWRRWHMTLSNWCQTYVYLPMLGLTRRPFLANYVSFLVIGLWHSASWGWIAWGLCHGTGVAVYMRWTQLRRKHRWTVMERIPLRWLGLPLTLAYVTLVGVLTALDGVGTPADALRIMAKMMGFNIHP